MKPKLVVFTGAEISAESGTKTFRASYGLWEEYNIMEVATAKNKLKINYQAFIISISLSEG
jgi:NAD-dependent SIR2 family protein deacetylase